VDQPLTLSLHAIPSRVYRDPYPLPFATVCFWLWVAAVTDQLVPRRASLDLMSAGRSVGSMLFGAAQLAALRGPAPRFSGLEDGLWLSHRIVTPQGVPVDLVRYQLELEVDGAARRLAVDLPVLDYQQRSSLVFPVAGRFTIVFGHASEGDHAERSQAFAYDIAPLGSRYELLADGDGTENAHFAGWERDVRAPAAGIVARVQEGLPDNPSPGHLPDLDSGPNGSQAVLGNGLVIDHGNAEFSLLGHMRQGSLLVRQGQRIEAGQNLGRVGNSGHSSGPHLHYHLMDGPELFLSDGLPARFVGLESEVPRRGAMDEAP
jgi:murein DD-endopeptidase MepM/ murein hydrolase activator NlpD